ncbi:MAG: sulfur carrier protein ThiS [Oligoflexus sp.]|jgi:sulfur carrier protein
MRIQVNGRELQVDQESLTIHGLLEELGYLNNFVAVAINETCVPRHDYTAYRVSDRDRVEILAPMAGG